MALRSSFKNKRANVVLDSFLIVLALSLFITLIVTGSYVIDQMNTFIQADSSLSNETKTISSNLNNDYPSTFDYSVGVILVLGWLFVLIASYNIDSHPVFFMISVIAMMIILFAVNSFMSGLDDYFAEPDIATVTANFPISMFVVTYMEYICVFMGFSIILAIYAKYKA